MAVTATRTAATISELREQAWGRVLTEQDEGYDEARKVQNAMFDRHPKVIVRCATAGDVIAAVNHARDNGLELAVRGGRSEEHTSELQSRENLVCRLLLE